MRNESVFVPQPSQSVEMNGATSACLLDGGEAGFRRWSGKSRNNHRDPPEGALHGAKSGGKRRGCINSRDRILELSKGWLNT